MSGLFLSSKSSQIAFGHLTLVTRHFAVLHCGHMAASDFTIGFDADDTLWHNEVIFEQTHERYRQLLARYHDAATVDRTLFATEMRNLELYGYGVKGFTLSAIETAIDLTGGRITTDEIRHLIELGREMLAHPVNLLEGVSETLAELSPRFRLVLITKGDLRDQERKLRKSGLADHFRQVEIVSEKDSGSYRRLFDRHAIDPERFLMVGNSLKSDILPVLTLGGAGAHIPYHLTWEAERAEMPVGYAGRLFQLGQMRELLAVVRNLAGHATMGA
jgi:putative hydrolase of the HAD superfamily